MNNKESLYDNEISGLFEKMMEELREERISETLNDLIFENQFFRYVNPMLTHDKCVSLVETDFAIVSIQLSTSSAVQYTKDITAKTIDKISALGKMCVK